MDNVFDNYRDSIDGWAEKWAKAQEDGVFDNYNPPKQRTSPVQSLTDELELAKQPERNNVDDTYWATTPQDGYVDPLHNPALLQEAAKTKGVEKAGDSQNPIPFWTQGKDQDYDPKHFEIADFEKLEEMKKRIHDLESDMASLKGSGRGNKQLESKISSMQKKLDDLSDEITTFSHDLPRHTNRDSLRPAAC